MWRGTLLAFYSGPQFLQVSWICVILSSFILDFLYVCKCETNTINRKKREETETENIPPGKCHFSQKRWIYFEVKPYFSLLVKLNWHLNHCFCLDSSLVTNLNQESEVSISLTQQGKLERMTLTPQTAKGGLFFDLAFSAFPLYPSQCTNAVTFIESDIFSQAQVD